MTTHHNFLERDIITVNFDPSVRTEIKKRRPAIVINKNGYNKGHSQVIACPITSTTKDSFFLVPLIAPVIQGILKPGSKVNTSQVFRCNTRVNKKSFKNWSAGIKRIFEYFAVCYAKFQSPN